MGTYFRERRFPVLIRINLSICLILRWFHV